MRTNGEFLTEREEGYHDMLDCVKWFDLKDGWTTESESKKMNVYYRFMENSPMIALKVEVTLDMPIKNLLTLVYETDL